MKTIILIAALLAGITSLASTNTPKPAAAQQAEPGIVKRIRALTLHRDKLEAQKRAADERWSALTGIAGGHSRSGNHAAAKAVTANANQIVKAQDALRAQIAAVNSEIDTLKLRAMDARIPLPPELQLVRKAPAPKSVRNPPR